jgi:hypothetical protein
MEDRVVRYMDPVLMMVKVITGIIRCRITSARYFPVPGTAPIE